MVGIRCDEWLVPPVPAAGVLCQRGESLSQQVPGLGGDLVDNCQGIG